MSTPGNAQQVADPREGRGNYARCVWLAALLIVAVTVVAYANSFGGAFVFDDGPSIVDNTSIRALHTAWSPPAEHGQTVGGRPLVNVSFALNYAASGLHVSGYHEVNLLIHVLAALTLFGIVRRTLLLNPRGTREGTSPTILAGAIALIWAVHPVQTAAVTYVVQRAESLCALFYLVTLYAFIRGATAARLPSVWFFAAALACAAGMACKEIMVTAPLMVLLYDRVFLAHSWRETWRRHWPVHLALATTWALLIALVAGTHGRAGSAGYASSISWSDYATTQIGAVVHYLRLAAWPQPLVFDYGTATVPHLAQVWPQALVLFALVLATGWAAWKRPAIGFLGVWFFLTLAPSSSVVPIATQTVAEHRVYLALAAVITGAVLLLYRWLGAKALAVCAVAAVAAVAGTLGRNRAYRTPLTLWVDTVDKVPGNARAQLNAGVQLASAGRAAEALAHFREAVRLAPDDSDAQNDLAGALLSGGHADEALDHYGDAVRLGPRNAKARRNYASALIAAQRWREAREQLGAADESEPTAAGMAQLAQVCLHLGAFSEAEQAARQVVRRDETFAPGHVALGEVLAQRRQLIEAEAEFRRALQLEPGSLAAHNNLGNVLLLTHRAPEAVHEFEAVVRVTPDAAPAHASLGVALALSGRLADGKRELEEALRLDPSNAVARQTLPRIERRLGADAPTR